MTAVIGLTAFVAGFIQTVSGFGGALVMMMTLPFFLPMTTSSALAGAVCIPALVTVAWKFRSKIRVKLALFPTLVYLVFSAICIRIAANVNLDAAKAVFGVFLILLAAYFNFVAGSFKLKANYLTAFVCAAISGVTGGMFGIGGPFLVLYFLAVTDDKEEYLGTINFVFVITETYSVIMRCINGLLTIDLAPVLAAGLIMVTVGRVLGGKVIDRIDGEKMKKVIYLMLAVAGAVTFVRAVF